MGTTILVIIAVYFSILMLISYLVGRKHNDNDAFFLGNRKSPWYIVAIGMIGASISGVTFISVPGMVGQFDMTYLQMVLGFIPGYFFVAYVLLPIYYRLNLTTVYGYLDQRFGTYSYKTGASFFILSRVVGSAAKLYLVALILQTLVFDQWSIPFYISVSGIILFIWLYTQRSGIRAIVWTDALQTMCLFIALILIIYKVTAGLGLDFLDLVKAVSANEHSRIFVFDDWGSKQNFFKQFFSGILIVIAMTGLDQDMMQKNLSVPNLKDAQKNMISYGIAFTPLNYLFLALGILLLLYASKYGIALPSGSDEILPMLATEYLGLPVLICFTIGIIASSFSNTDSALASLTTTICVDLLSVKKEDARKAKRIRQWVHLLVSILFLLFILIIHHVGQNNILDTIYKAASYTYGPLLGMFFIGLFTKIQLRDKLVPFICVLAPVLSFVLEFLFKYFFDYNVGYEILLFNGLATGLGLWCISVRQSKPVKI
jgi:Na+/proline symporter